MTQDLLIQACALEEHDEIITEPKFDEYGTLTFPAKRVLWRVKSFYVSGDVVFLVCAGHEEGSDVFFNSPTMRFRMTMAITAKVLVRREVKV